jgi:hypothetical protein
LRKVLIGLATAAVALVMFASPASAQTEIPIFNIPINHPDLTGNISINPAGVTGGGLANFNLNFHPNIPSIPGGLPGGGSFQIPNNPIINGVFTFGNSLPPTLLRR